jgi:hypothetical protein
MADRRFDEREVGALIRRAAELKAVASEGGGDDATLSQIRQAASELGIESEYIERAAAEMGNRGKGHGIWGGSVSVRQSVTVAGRITADRWPILLQQVRDMTGRVGTPRSVGDGFEWVSLQPDGIHVSVIPDGEKSRISIHSNIGNWLALSIILPLAGSLLIGAAAAGILGWAGAGVGVFVALCTLLASRAWFARIAKSRDELIAKLFAQLETEIAKPIGQTPIGQIGIDRSAPVADSVIEEMRVRLG